MSTLAPEQAPAVGDPLGIQQRTLPRWAPWAVLVAVLAVVAGIFALTPLSGQAQAVVLSALVYIVAISVVSAAYEGRRRAKDRTATTLVTAAFILAVIPLVSVLGYTILEGVHRLTPYFLLHSMRDVGPRDATGGVYHAIVGTLEQVLIASVIAIPIGILTAVYLVEYGRGRLAKAVTFFVDVMTGIPSIVAGLFILAFWVLGLHQGYSGLAGGLALSILMMPTVVRSSEEMLKLVPNELREASLALGVPRWRTILKIVLPTAIAGIVTGVMLAVARVTGETAPVLVTVFGTDSINMNPFKGAQSSLPLFVFDQTGRGTTFATDRAWAAALTLIVIVMLFNLVARLVARFFAPKISR
jgi:phosphate transport system permease protein